MLISSVKIIETRKKFGPRRGGTFILPFGSYAFKRICPLSGFINQLSLAKAGHV